MRLAVLTAICAASAALTAVPALGSVEVAVDPRGSASLRVDAAGNAEVRWTAADGTQPASGVAIPWPVAVRQTPDGSYFGLQAWRRLVGGPVELRFSRGRASRRS